ncbi:MAG: SPOR domain-containing protein [Proteobacteria bacterium]|nr:SPOR domain-containing protein [Pseudomonadota bacterium]
MRYGCAIGVLLVSALSHADTGFAISVASYLSEQQAQSAASDFRAHTLEPVNVTLATTPERLVYRVVVGPWADQSSAAARLDNVRSRVPDAWIVSVPYTPPSDVDIADLPDTEVPDADLPADPVFVEERLHRSGDVLPTRSGEVLIEGYTDEDNRAID